VKTDIATVKRQFGKHIGSSRIGAIAGAAVMVSVLASCDGGSSVSGSGVNPADDSPVLKAEQADELIRNSMIGFYSDSSNSFGRNDVLAFGGDIAVAESAADSAAPSDGGGGSRFSDTNVQEAGVDEADRVKIDGNTLFALEKISPQYVGIWPVAAEIAVADSLFPAPEETKETLSAYTLDTVNSSTLSRLQLDTGSQTPEGMYLHKNGTSRELVMISRENFNNWAYWSYPRRWTGFKTRVTWFDASDATDIKKGRTMDFDGQLVSSRKINNRLIMVTRYHPNLDGIIPYPVQESDFEFNRDLISNADIADLLPGYELTVNGQASSASVVSDNRCYRAQAVNNEDGDSDESTADELSIYYPSPTVLSIITIDLNSSNSNVQNTCFIGDTETMYVSQNALYLATTKYDYRINDDGNGRPIADYYEPEITTEIHKFSFNGNSAPVFKGSGSVSGHLGWYQERKPYRMSEKDNNLRVVTFDQSREGSPVTLNILTESGGATLRTLSTLPNENRPEPIGKVGENLYASRFIGDRAYLVTFLLTDPLYVLDVSSPTDPYIAGELELPGYSEYLHAVNDGLLVGLGKEAIPAENNGWGNGRGAWYQGVKLSLFDVSDPTAPRESDSRVIGKRGTDSPALYQPHSFAYLSGAGGVNPKIAFPLALHNEAPFGTGPNAWSDWTSNHIATMEVDEAANQFVDVPFWVFESREKGHTYSPVNLQNDRAIIGDDGGLYAIHNGSLFYGLWGEDTPSSSSE
jgi:hypothetical protein